MGHILSWDFTTKSDNHLHIINYIRNAAIMIIINNTSVFIFHVNKDTTNILDYGTKI